MGSWTCAWYSYRMRCVSLERTGDVWWVCDCGQRVWLLGRMCFAKMAAVTLPCPSSPKTSPYHSSLQRLELRYIFFFLFTCNSPMWWKLYYMISRDRASYEVMDFLQFLLVLLFLSLRGTSWTLPHDFKTAQRSMGNMVSRRALCWSEGFRAPWGWDQISKTL